MRKARIFLPMIFWVVLVHGTSFGSQSGVAQEQTSSQSAEKSANSSRAGSNDTQARGGRDQRTEYLPSDENQKSVVAVKAGTRKHRPAVSYAKLPQNRQLRSAKAATAKDLQTEALRNVPGSHPISPTLSSVPGKTVRHSSRPVSPSTVALNGQQFKNFRDPGARMASSGGPANSTRGTGTINGTDVKRKP
jgi:hypothetical protein